MLSLKAHPNRVIAKDVIRLPTATMSDAQH